MTYEIIITIVITTLALIFFASSKFSVDVVSVAIMVVLVISGVLEAGEAVQGFANSATLTVAAMFVLSHSLIKTGIISQIASFFSEVLSRGYYVGVSVLSVVVGVVSAFINNTPVVATFIPVVSTAAKDAGKSPANYLIPLSYGAIFGGACTLIGTSTNLLISGIAQDHGKTGFSMFELAPLGVVFFIIGTLYLMLFGKNLIPIRQDDEDRKANINNFLSEVRVSKDFNEEKKIADVFSDLDILMLKREDKKYESPSGTMNLKPNDVLLIRGNMKSIESILKDNELYIKEYQDDKQLPEEQTELVEIVIPANSMLEGKKLSQVDMLQKYNARALAIRHRGTESFTNLEDVSLRAGDIILIQTNRQGSELIHHEEQTQETPFLAMNSQSLTSIPRRKLIIVITTILGVVFLASFKVLPIMIAAFAGIIVLTLTNVITMQEAYRAIDWKVIFLLAGSLSLGTAMNESGLTALIGKFFKEEIGQNYSLIIIIASLYLIASVLTEIISNNATAALLTPLVIELSSDIDLSLTSLLLTLAFACSSSFATPVSYQTNTMVFSAGIYKYFDFMRVGLPLKLLFWIVASVLITLYYSSS